LRVWSFIGCVGTYLKEKAVQSGVVKKSQQINYRKVKPRCDETFELVCRPSIIGLRRHNDWLEKIDQNHRKKRKRKKMMKKCSKKKKKKKNICGKEKILEKNE
jgi:hypothetical protein